MLYGLGVLLDYTVELCVVSGIENYLVHNVEVGLLAHGLNLRDYLSDKALLDKLGGEVRVYGDGDSVVGDSKAALLLDGVYEQVVNAELYFIAVDIELQSAVLVELLLGGRAVERGEVLLNLSEESAVFRADGLELRLEAVGSEVLYLKRLRMGSLVLDETLKPGEYRTLTQKEIDELYNCN